MDLTQARAIFFHDSRELCDALEAALLDRERYPAGRETYNLLFRTAHTIKGSAGIWSRTCWSVCAQAISSWTIIW